jgi:hypothetical protein
MLIDKKNLPPNKRRLFLFIFFSLIHIILLINIYFELKYCILVIFELSFFLYFNKSAYKIILKIILISSIIFLLNIFFSEGKIVYKNNIIKITQEGLKSGIKKVGLLICTFLYTLNILKDKKEDLLLYIQSKKGNNIILNSINYFLIFWEELGENNNIKKLFAKIINIYKNNRIKIKLIKKKEILIKRELFIYHFLFFIGFLLIYFFL